MLENDLNLHHAKKTIWSIKLLCLTPNIFKRKEPFVGLQVCYSSIKSMISKKVLETHSHDRNRLIGLISYSGKRFICYAPVLTSQLIHDLNFIKFSKFAKKKKKKLKCNDVLPI